MTAPARVTPSRQPRTRPTPPRGNAPVRERRTPAQPRPRTAAAEKAYARRAQRLEKTQRSGRVQRPQRVRRSEKLVGRPAQATRRAAQPASTATFVVVLMSLLVAGVVATLWLSTQATADSYLLENAKQQTANLSQQRGRLQEQVARAESATSIADKATKLGMVPATDPAHLVVGKNGKIRVIGSPTAAKGDPKPPPAQAKPAPSPAKPVSQQQKQAHQASHSAAQQHTATHDNPAQSKRKPPAQRH